MITWLSANLGTIIVCALLLAVVFLAARSLIRDKKRGKSPCCGSCPGCSGCHCAEPTRGESK